MAARWLNHTPAMNDATHSIITISIMRDHNTMTLDKEEHRALLLELIDNAAFPGKARKIVVELADAIEGAAVTEPKPAARKNV